ncbi:MAG: hypothetical protein ACK55E_15145 [Cyanobacteriota bacterium]|jgi:hypothetical protein
MAYINDEVRPIEAATSPAIRQVLLDAMAERRAALVGIGLIIAGVPVINLFSRTGSHGA